VLTVGDADHFVSEGGVIGFCLEEKKIRFEINLNAATKAKLKLSAKLLSLAKTVIGDPRAH
jgi:YfiR/HmsC-like